MRSARQRPERFSLGTAELEAIYREHATAFVAYFARRVRIREDALDLTAETFAQAYRSRNKFRGEDADEALAWLFGIAHNLRLRHARDAEIHLRAIAKLRLDRQPLDESKLAVLEGSSLDVELELRVRRALERLPEAQRHAIVRRIIDEQSYAEIATETGETEQTVRARVSRGLRRLGIQISGVGNG